MKLFLSGIFLFFACELSAQLSTTSPYSRFGIGELHAGISASNFGLGGVSASWKDSYTINSSNPASYSFLRATTFQIEGFGEINKRSTATNTNDSLGLAASGLDNVNFVFKKMNSSHSFALGLKKYSSMGYEVTDSLSTSDYNVVYSYQGFGNINDLTIGYAYLFKWKGFNGIFEPNPSLDSLDREQLYIPRHFLSFGANFDWMFGNLLQNKHTNFDDASFYNTSITNDLSVNSTNFTLGFQSSINLIQKGILKTETQREKMDLVVGMSYALQKDIDISRNYQSLAVIPNSAEILVDQDLNQAGVFKLPSRLNIGTGLVYSKNKTRMQWGIDYQQQDWTQTKLVFGTDTLNDTFAKASSLATGFEITPKSLDKSEKYLGLMTYRLGYRSTKTYWLINNNNITETAFTAGISMPLLGSKSFSRFNFGTEIGTRGTTDTGLIREKFINFQAGFTFTPLLKYNRWFVLRKYD